MGIHWLEYDIGIVGKHGKNASVVTEEVNVNCLAYVEMNTPKYGISVSSLGKPAL
jgi:hypothetical protein